MFPIGDFYGIQQREWKHWFGIDQMDQNLYRFQQNLSVIEPPSVGNPDTASLGQMVNKFVSLGESFHTPTLEIRRDYRTLQRIELNRKMEQFNWFTLSGRPFMNRLSSLPRTERYRLKAKRGKLVMLDFQAYVLQLLGDITNYEFTEYPYGQVGIDKQKIFPILFGENDLPYTEFFDGVRPIKSRFDGDGRVTLSNGKVCDTFFNYTTNIETLTNLKFARAFMRHLPQALIFYLYDAFLFDLKEEEIDLFVNLCGKLPYKYTAEIGDDWGNLEPFSQLSEFAF